ncbi:tRNA (adenine(22)-N(1))-methyltransferase TrmK [Gemella sp. GH3]|uniref:tRNA (adenine(22)-N(1))-methyltransferase n=1 Tax=unclassified Gemella TaxID=2624949 RepID=UPI0015CFB2C1|nr:MULTISPECIES: tRNA (adenine(22)-N(1))-methyltransferase TrmK [unclassified Gemella]MBF0713459.1 tRNA (adenine(22)-N(1))-methyltransferase TrmK [Gemella sp. GH3.1]NYS50411.1 tRNA (adenine(22)-N(1))-methyltransferase TrmK [Gemella sp. GH3]
MSINIKNRLKKVAEFVEYRRLADIGSDHAYLPIYLAQKDQVDFAIAGEVVEGPHKVSIQNVKDNNLTNVINCIKGSGLEVFSLDDNIEVITICGMGGKLIADILESGKDKLVNVEQLILQPNVASNLVREKLEQLNYNIYAEDILEEDGHIYEIIVAKKGEMNLSEEEKIFGRYLLKQKQEIFIKKYEEEINKIDYILKQLENSTNKNLEKIKDLQNMKSMIKSILY